MPAQTASLKGKRLGYIRRQSTERQDGNYSTQSQLVDLPAWLTSQGATPVAYDEGAISGRDLAKRKRARELLEDVRVRAVDGLAVQHLDRLTRDEYGTDAGVIAEILVVARALLVTPTRVYKLWDKEDLFSYRLETGLAGREMLTNRDRMWRGLFVKARNEPFFMGQTPYGYTVDLVEEKGYGTASRKRVKRVPRCEEACRPAMADLETALDACQSLGEVCAKMNAAHHAVPRHTSATGAVAARWTTTNVRLVLENPLYAGAFAVGRHSKRESTIWDTEHVTAGVQPGAELIDCPHLAWFDRAKWEGWRTRFLAPVAPGRPRHRVYDLPLRGVLCCPGCGRPLASAGQAGYRCEWSAHVASGDVCPVRQSIKAPLAFDALAAELPNALRARAEYDAVLRDALTHNGELDELRSKHAMRCAQIEKMIETFYPADGDYEPAAEEVALLARRKRERDQLGERIAQLDTARATSPAIDQAVARLVDDPLPAFRSLPEEVQGAILRAVFTQVILDGQGATCTRRYTVRAGYVNRLLDTSVVSGGSATTTLAYLASLMRE